MGTTCAHFADNALKCANGHDLCTACVAKLVEPRIRPCCESCSSFHFTCPLCRSDACMRQCHVLVVLKDSWDKMFEWEWKRSPDDSESESYESE